MTESLPGIVLLITVLILAYMVITGRGYGGK